MHCTTGCPKSFFLEFHALQLLIKTIFLNEISKRCLLLYRVLVFRSSVTGMPPFFFIPFWYGGATSIPKQYHFLDQAAEKKKTKQKKTQKKTKIYIYIYIYIYIFNFGRSSKKENLFTVRLKCFFTNLRRAR